MNSSKRVIQTQQKNDTQANPIQKISSRLVGKPYGLLTRYENRKYRLSKLNNI